ncbi:hypothetical protein AB6A40_009640 [Gnathostoma spinigerum]|uniref:Uncharacterized protein n=1 Tax=Gnathostoma spinigerum TaxID=75299 RepID=A0ABD6EZH8_9BILA
MNCEDCWPSRNSAGNPTSLSLSADGFINHPLRKKFSSSLIYKMGVISAYVQPTTKTTDTNHSAVEIA